MSMNHMIMKQVIELRVDATVNAFAVQQQLSGYYHNHIVPVIEKVFDEIYSQDEVISIDLLEIDLGTLGWQNNSFTIDETTIYQQLKKSLSNIPAKRRTPEENACRQWIFYMKNGSLPWEVHHTDKQWLKKILHQLAIDNELTDQIKKLMISNYWSASRVARHHDETFLQQLLEVISAKRQDNLAQKIKKAVDDARNTTENALRVKEKIWRETLRHISLGENEIDLDKIMLANEKPETTSLKTDQKILSDGIYCQYAGLVLLHPFLRHLFSHLRFVEDGQFVNQIAREKAIMLMFFVATGKIEPEDHELIVPKILCGLPTYQVIEEVFSFSEEEKLESLNMMSAATAQWTIMHNTTPDGLREGFLMRKGKVVFNDAGISFRVESSAIDVLLDHLPWNLSLIRLPWLDKLIRVEWR